jgi:hypothetical protein
MSKELQCSHRLLKSGGGMSKNVSVLIDYWKLVVICQGNSETKKNTNEAGELHFGKYKMKRPLCISVHLYCAALSVA